MALEFFRRAAGVPRTLGVLPAAFNPPTRAHVVLAEAALDLVDEVLLVLPRVFPHKSYEDADFEQRIRMLLVSTEARSRYSVASSDGGLFIEIAAGCHEAYGNNTRLRFICGRDAAERIVNWDYGEACAFPRMLQTFDLLVASRQGEFLPAEEIADGVHALRLPEDIDAISATEVRERIRRGQPWEHLVPAEIVPLVRETYGPGRLRPERPLE